MATRSVQKLTHFFMNHRYFCQIKIGIDLRKTKNILNNILYVTI